MPVHVARVRIVPIFLHLVLFESLYFMCLIIVQDSKYE